MSKSLGNVITAHDALSQYGGNNVRLLLISTHYRAPVNFSYDLLAACNNEITKMTNIMRQLAVKLQEFNVSFANGKSRFIEPFLNALADDLNTSNALSELHNVIKLANQSLRKKDVDLSEINDLFSTLKDEFYILGVNIEYPILSSEDKDLLSEYNLAKSSKDFAKSDELRKKLIDKRIL